MNEGFLEFKLQGEYLLLAQIMIRLFFLCLLA